MQTTTEEKEYPFYIKAPIILIGLFFFFYILMLLRAVLIPFAFAGLIAILLNPLFSRLHRKLPRVAAILITLLIATLVVSLLFYFLSSQIAMFGESLPALKAKTTTLLNFVSNWLHDRLNISVDRQVAALRAQMSG